MKVKTIRLLEYTGKNRSRFILRIHIDFNGADLQLDHEMSPVNAGLLAQQIVSHVAFSGVLPSEIQPYEEDELF